jgi:hypothetical protein
MDRIYQIVTAKSVKELEEQVNVLLAQDDELVGGPFIDDRQRQWCQALIGPAKDKDVDETSEMVGKVA